LIIGKYLVVIYRYGIDFWHIGEARDYKGSCSTVRKALAFYPGVPSSIPGEDTINLLTQALGVCDCFTYITKYTTVIEPLDLL
jgi:hypothetical protein